ncbi:MAG: tetratricopeptide repeat protein [candidate division KSB1 bacterium]|nr:tetratricopeptide repeat protein [candidate division KSB1 bacterium]MDZ7276408.1 tetratricopeptide repeat protein [candidate division KSB1 bacterium]MDZ7288079.1 tetratricopeptide repeat protein [candidate division KSB1 bacterium]MDZ7300179.1 tetratricopeptide repeat protein [candidate division KSB1 bacterium]MDZ7305751.1 tetratricopeptide repeat protein [candidate division KSB1 bacterium]
MKITSLFAAAASSALLWLPLATVSAQSQQTEALAWFQAGLKEQDPQKKIAAYQRAITLDPEFVEALYNLGVTYKRRGDLGRAEEYLRRASIIKREGVKNETRFQILYELAGAYRRLEKPAEAETAWREARRLTTNADMRARIALELGRLLAQQGRHQEALTELREGRGLSSENQADFTALIDAIEREVEMQRLYQAAEGALAARRYAEARTLLEQLRAKDTGYRDVTAKLALIDSLLTTEARQTTVAALYDQARRYVADGRWELAVAAYENIQQQAPGYKDVAAQLENARRQLEQKQLTENLEREYASGMAALKARNWARAILAFEEVLRLDRNFRDARKRLSEAQNGLDRESSESVAARYYAEGVSAYGRNDLGAALAALEKVRQINPGYRDTSHLLAEIEAALQPRQSVTVPAPTAAVSSPQVDSLYQAGMAAFDRQDWAQAVFCLEKVQTLAPNYQQVVDYLAQARTNLHLSTPRRAAQAEPGGGLTPAHFAGVLLLVGIVLGVILLSPASRARLQLLRGNHAAAVALYEDLLARHPQRAKFYTNLANLYLLMGRTDEKAMKVFKTVLQLNLATRHRDRIALLVEQNAPPAGRLDADAGAVLGNAMRPESNKQ